MSTLEIILSLCTAASILANGYFAWQQNQQRNTVDTTKLAVDTVTKASADVRQDLENEKNETTRLREDRERLHKQLYESTELIKDLRAQLDIDRKEIDSTTTKVKALESEMKELNTQRENLRVEVGSLTGQLMELRRVSQLEIELREMRLKLGVATPGTASGS